MPSSHLRKQSRLYRAVAKARTLWVLRSVFAKQPRAALEYVRSEELDNFTYEIGNEEELARFIADVLGVAPRRVAHLRCELQEDIALRERLAVKLRPRTDRRDEPLFGRRIGWYCMVRLVKPSLVVETGTHDGLGTALLLRALERNAEEGSVGRLPTFDIDAASGWLLEEHAMLERVVGDTRKVLPRTLKGVAVDVFIHDSATRTSTSASSSRQRSRARANAWS